MVFFHTTLDKINFFPPKKDFLHEKRSNPKIELDLDKNSLDHDFVYLKGNQGSCYWTDSKGLTMHFCDVGSVTDISQQDIHLTLSIVLASASSFDEKCILSFAERLLVKIEAVFDASLNPDNTIDIFLAWKSIALLILSSDHTMNAGIGVRIGSGYYRIPC
ncbi:MAG: hypothetical protein JW705_08245 [Methanosarcinaceae archaeon]|nr:hypothetical protein [Methanosarcinaceae archaeon]